MINQFYILLAEYQSEIIYSSFKNCYVNIKNQILIQSKEMKSFVLLVLTLQVKMKLID